jgi:hypothetical protein
MRLSSAFPADGAAARIESRHKPEIWTISGDRCSLGGFSAGHRIAFHPVMNSTRALILALSLLHPASAESPAARVLSGHSAEAAGFKLDPVPPPAINDATAGATFTVISGRADPNSGSLDVLKDGKIPGGNDEPRSNFFFAGGAGPHRLAVDLGKVTALRGIATYSWHSGSRAGQQYQLYAADGAADGFQATPGAGVDPASVGWRPVAKVDTSGKGGGQHASAILGPEGAALGTYRHLLFEVTPNQDARGFGQTFFSEIDVVAMDGPQLARIEAPKKEINVFKGKGVTITLDSTASPDLLPWFKETAIPAMEEWYPKISALIAIPGKTPPAPKAFTIELREGQIIPGRDGIPGFASGDRIVVSSRFMRDQMQGEALGCLIHEMVHIVQFGAGKRAHRTVPVWFYEGATDYIRWFLFEPEKNGAVIRNPERVNYNDSYRTTANFMDWVIKNHSKDLMAQAHIAIHEGYSDELWQNWTGKPVAELDKEWKEYLRKQLADR